MTTPASISEPAFKSRVFLFGEDMNPSTVLGRWPGSRFIAIACADGGLTKVAGFGENALGPEVWGIIVETGVAQRGSAVPLTLVDGSSTTAMLVSEASNIGAPLEILAEANYWELPQAYRDQITAHIETATAD